jgi:hypothetical protein
MASIPVDILCEICRLCDITTAVSLGEACQDVWRIVTDDYKWITQLEADLCVRRCAITLPIKMNYNVDVTLRERVLRGCKRHFNVDKVYVNWHKYGMTVITKNMDDFLRGCRWVFGQKWVGAFINMDHVQVIMRVSHEGVDAILNGGGVEKSCIHIPNRFTLPVVNMDVSRRDTFMDVGALHKYVGGKWMF